VLLGKAGDFLALQRRCAGSTDGRSRCWRRPLLRPVACHEQVCEPFVFRKRSAYDNLLTRSVRHGIERWMGCVHFVRPTAGYIGRRSASVVHKSYNNRRTHSRTLCFFTANGSFLRSGIGCNTNETVGANPYTGSRFQLRSPGNAQNHLPSRFWKYTRARLRGSNKRGNRGKVFLGFGCQPPQSCAKSPKEVGHKLSEVLLFHIVWSGCWFI
jgi:hypothetical protein